MEKKPLPNYWTAIGILGFVISLVYTYYGKLSNTWGILFMIIFFIMTVASIESLRNTLNFK